MAGYLEGLKNHNKPAKLTLIQIHIFKLKLKDNNFTREEHMGSMAGTTERPFHETILVLIFWW